MPVQVTQHKVLKTPSFTTNVNILARHYMNKYSDFDKNKVLKATGNEYRKFNAFGVVFLSGQLERQVKKCPGGICFKRNDASKK